MAWRIRYSIVDSLAREVERRAPDAVTTSWWKEERGKRLFIDSADLGRQSGTPEKHSHPLAQPWWIKTSGLTR